MMCEICKRRRLLERRHCQVVKTWPHGYGFIIYNKYGRVQRKLLGFGTYRQAQTAALAKTADPQDQSAGDC